MHDIPAGDDKIFQDVRPLVVSDEGSAADTHSPEVIANVAMNSVTELTIKMSNQFQDQFVAKYTPRIFPWALNYDCGGAEYPGLFADWDALLESEASVVAASIQQRWRRVAGEAPLLPGEYAKMLATRPEMQIAGDWMVVPAARNLHWRYAVLH